MGNNKDILDEWVHCIEKYPTIKIKEAKRMYSVLSECNDEQLKKQLRNELIMNTLYVVVNFVKNNGLIYLNNCSYDMSDIISICNEIWINKIDSGVLMNVESYNEIFDSDFYNKLSSGLNINIYPVAENTALNSNIFIDLLLDYMKLKEANRDFNYYDLVEYMKTNKKYNTILYKIFYFGMNSDFTNLFDAIINSFELSDEDINVSKTKLEKLKYIIISNGLEYLRCNIDEVICPDISDLLIQDYCMKKFYEIIFEGDRLSDIQKDILKKRFGFSDGHCWTLEKTAKFHGVTRERIRQREAKILRLLRHPSFAKKYKDLI